MWCNLFNLVQCYLTLTFVLSYCMFELFPASAKINITTGFFKELVFNNFLLNGPAEAWNNTDLTWAFGLTCRDTTAWSGRSKRVIEPPWQYWVRPLLFVLDMATEYWNPLGHGCDVSISPSPRMSRPTTIFSGAFSSQVKVLVNSVRTEGWVSTVDGLQASLVHSRLKLKIRKDAQIDSRITALAKVLMQVC